MGSLLRIIDLGNLGMVGRRQETNFGPGNSVANRSGIRPRIAEAASDNPRLFRSPVQDLDTGVVHCGGVPGQPYKDYDPAG